jgi:NitT/TauT family transport system substrate-binding protein
MGVEITSSIGRYMLERVLSMGGLTMNDIDLRPFGQTVLTDQVLRGNLDAIITYEPYSSSILARRSMTTLFDTSMIPEEVLDVVVVTPEMLAAEPDLSRRLQLAWQSALDYASAHPEETTQLFARRYGVTPEAYAHMSKDIKIFSRSDMQRFISLHQLHQSIWRIAQALRPEVPISRNDISSTVAVWHQKEARP